MSSKRIGFFSYGSGCVAEFFSGIVQPGYKRFLQAEKNAQFLNERKKLLFAEYEHYYSYTLPQDGQKHLVEKYTNEPFRFCGLDNHERLYTKS